MPVRDRINTYEMVNALKTTPLVVLQNHPLMVALAPGDVTEQSQIAFSLTNGNILIGTVAPNNGTTVVIRALVTPTRNWNSPHRFTALQRFNPIAEDFWVTERQTGCSLIILDWGGQMSMGHLLPHPQANYNRVNRYILDHAPLTAYAEIQRQSLKPEVTQLVEASKIGGVNPQRYILVQSNHAAVNQKNLNVIGIRSNGQMSFYMQTNTAGGRTVQQLRWTAWRPYLPYFTY
ncbi:hypothetical protein GTP81_17745 [Rugamonas sp. FT107W]|uniref:Uncharacterized protein n=1 Tax=Duganella vulcania TaxID=2692166 RepID=A0A845HM56_9BURK|nr:hypothetical protein [Duganella vulcania]MYN18595.1 hypothetical protein [Duganella vulcania]